MSIESLVSRGRRFVDIDDVVFSEQIEEEIVGGHLRGESHFSAVKRKGLN